MTKYIFPLVLLLLTTACTTAYVEPVRSDLAILTVINGTKTNSIIQGFKNASDCSGGKLHFGDSEILAWGNKVIRVVPNEPFSFFIWLGRPIGDNFSEIFRMPMTFTPLPNRDYYLTYQESEGKMRLKMEIKDDIFLDKKIQDKTFKLREWRAAFLEDGSFCKPETPKEIPNNP